MLRIEECALHDCLTGIDAVGLDASGELVWMSARESTLTLALAAQRAAQMAMARVGLLETLERVDTDSRRLAEFERLGLSRHLVQLLGNALLYRQEEHAQHTGLEVKALPRHQLALRATHVAFLLCATCADVLKKALDVGVLERRWLQQVLVTIEPPRAELLLPVPPSGADDALAHTAAARTYVQCVRQECETVVASLLIVSLACVNRRQSLSWQPDVALKLAQYLRGDASLVSAIVARVAPDTVVFAMNYFVASNVPLLQVVNQNKSESSNNDDNDESVDNNNNNDDDSDDDDDDSDDDDSDDDNDDNDDENEASESQINQAKLQESELGHCAALLERAFSAADAAVQRLEEERGADDVFMWDVITPAMMRRRLVQFVALLGETLDACGLTPLGVRALHELDRRVSPANAVMLRGSDAAMHVVRRAQHYDVIALDAASHAAHADTLLRLAAE
eukprot:CAMPEP_0168596580 /NCGR_PEP_ID=MMETSP0420-20121227/10094_1 /TAXON_ID=498008 /ORGANISM="Pessonella sp." /LENGTH=452 /DNA_ID=CAMNT_0008633149 /DNA_START=634 /DNA_END=1992 /DNA_ORIENTATION=+